MAHGTPPEAPATPTVQRAGAVTAFLAAAAADRARAGRQSFRDSVDDQVGSFTDKIADVQDAAALIRDPTQLRQVVKQRGMDALADANPIAGALLGYRRGGYEPEGGGGFGVRGGSSRARGRGEHQEMEQLAEKLVAPLARLLRTELRMDRERMGRLRDSGR